MRGLVLILFGVPIYFLLEMYYDPRAIRIIDDFLAYFTLFTERIALPVKVRKEIVRLLGNIKGKTVLEFGCNVGTLTMDLAEEVGDVTVFFPGCVFFWDPPTARLLYRLMSRWF